MFLLEIIPGGRKMIEKNNKLGTLDISLDVVATVAGGAATECYGVVGMASQKVVKDGFYELLRKENFSKGIVARNGEVGLILDLYVILGYGIKISEILVEVQKKVKYVLESTLDVKVEAVNVYVQGLRSIK
jgi:uncharacterized alkaline shock family protein YloU